MTHRAEQIIDAVVAAIEARTDLGCAVFKNRTLSLSAEDQELPGICVNMGEDSPSSDTGYENLAYIDSALTVEIALYAQADSQQELVTELVRMRTVVHKTLLASPRDLGLSFVMRLGYGGASKPELSTEGSPIGGRLECPYGVFYRMGLTDPE